MRQRVGIIIATTLFAVACAIVPSSTDADTGVLSQISSGATPAVRAADVARSAHEVIAERASTTLAPNVLEQPSAEAAAEPVDTRDDEEPGHLGPESDPVGPPPTLALAAAPTTAPAPTTTVAPAPTTTVSPAPTTVPAPPTTVPPTTTAAPPTTTTPPPAPVGDPGAASSFVAEINALRASAGLGALTRSGDLDARAQSWSNVMAADGSLRHSTIISELVAGSWSTAGENIGYGPSVAVIFDGLRNSSGHYANMVNGAFTTVGVGVTVVDGTMWTTHLFAG